MDFQGLYGSGDCAKVIRLRKNQDASSSDSADSSSASGEPARWEEKMCAEDMH